MADLGRSLSKSGRMRPKCRRTRCTRFCATHRSSSVQCWPEFDRLWLVPVELAPYSADVSHNWPQSGKLWALCGPLGRLRPVSVAFGPDWAKLGPMPTQGGPISGKCGTMTAKFEAILQCAHLREVAWECPDFTSVGPMAVPLKWALKAWIWARTGATGADCCEEADVWGTSPVRGTGVCQLWFRSELPGDARF